MAVNMIKAKTIRCGMKRGMDVADFCAKYECTEEEFQKRVRLIFKYEADDILREISESDKTRKTDGKRTDTNEGVAVAIIDVAMDGVLDLPDTPCDVETVAEKIRKLREEEMAQSSVVMNLENHHKTLAGEHRDRIKALREIQENLDQIKVKFQKYAARYEQIVGENNAIIAEMNEISAKRRQEKSKLDGIREEIRKLETVGIVVYNDGTIAPMDETLDVELDDTGFEAALSTLMAEECCQDLRVKDIQTVARLICVIKNSQVELEVIFENEDVELACLMLRDEGKF